MTHLFLYTGFETTSKYYKPLDASLVVLYGFPEPPNWDGEAPCSQWEIFLFAWPDPWATLAKWDLPFCVCVCAVKEVRACQTAASGTSSAACCFFGVKEEKHGVKDGPAGPEPNHESLNKYEGEDNPGGPGVRSMLIVFSLLCPAMDNGQRCCLIPQYNIFLVF